MFIFVLSGASGLKTAKNFIKYKMGADIVYSKLKISDGKFPKDLLSDLEEKANQSFKTRNMKVIDGYFEEGSQYYPKNLSFLILARDEKEKNLVGGLIATKEAINNFEFAYYDKIFVIPDYRGNGVMKGIIDFARIEMDNKKILPSMLRTTDFGLHQEYSKMSDRWAQKKGGAQNIRFYVHGFGFLDKTRKELFEGAEKKFELAANYVANKPATAVPINYATINL